MKRLLVIVSAFILSIFFQVGQVAHASIDTTTPPVKLDNSPLLISAYFISSGTPNYFELYNSSSEPVDVSKWQLSLSWKNTSDPTSNPISETSIALSNQSIYIPPKSFIVVGFGSAVLTPSVQVNELSSASNVFISQIQLANQNYAPFIKSFTSPQQNRMQLNQTSSGFTTTGTYSIDVRQSLYDNGFYLPRSSFPLAPIEILANPVNCSPLDSSLDCNDYIKFYNNTDQPVSFDGTRLHSGSTTVQLTGIVNPGQYAIFNKSEDGAPLSITNSGGYVWLEDIYGTVIYSNTVTQYADASSSTHKGEAWAMLDGVWQWSLPNPSGENVAIPQKTESKTDTRVQTPCRSDQFRNPLTNRCKLVSTSTTNLSPCLANQYRSTETNRCRSLVATSSTLKPCSADQYRNLETNRCRSATTSATSLQPCAANQVRNPDTNRCRKVGATIPSADYAVSQTGNATNSKAIVTWLIVAGLLLVALGYAIWEWRHELATMATRMITKIKKP